MVRGRKNLKISGSLEPLIKPGTYKYPISAITLVSQYNGMILKTLLYKNLTAPNSGLKVYAMMKPDIMKKISTPICPMSNIELATGIDLILV